MNPGGRFSLLQSDASHAEGFPNLEQVWLTCQSHSSGNRTKPAHRTQPQHCLATLIGPKQGITLHLEGKKTEQTDTAYEPTGCTEVIHYIEKQNHCEEVLPFGPSVLKDKR